jgi:hypothetical protein
LPIMSFIIFGVPRQVSYASSLFHRDSCFPLASAALEFGHQPASCTGFWH